NARADLAWQAVANATSYRVKRATTNAGPWSTIATGVTATGYADTGLTNGTTYYYVVSAVNAAGESPDSAGAVAVPQPPPSPPPTKLAARNSGTRRVALSWTNPAGVAVVQNYVYRATGNGAFTMIAVLGPSSSYTDTTVTSGRTYRYSVTAVAVYNGAAQE